MEATLPCTFFRWAELLPILEPCSPDAVFPDVTRHGSFISASLGQCHPISLLPKEKVASSARRMRWKRPVSLQRRQRLPHFQSSMLLHNLSSVFSPCVKFDQRAAPSCTARPPQRTRPQAPTRALPAAAQHQRQLHRIRARSAPIPSAAASFPHAFHRVFHNSGGFPQRLSFPLAFFERDRVRSSEHLVPTAQ